MNMSDVLRAASMAFGAMSPILGIAVGMSMATAILKMLYQYMFRFIGYEPPAAELPAEPEEDDEPAPVRAWRPTRTIIVCAHCGQEAEPGECPGCGSRKRVTVNE